NFLLEEPHELARDGFRVVSADEHDSLLRLVDDDDQRDRLAGRRAVRAGDHVGRALHVRHGHVRDLVGAVDPPRDHRLVSIERVWEHEVNMRIVLVEGANHHLFAKDLEQVGHLGYSSLVTRYDQSTYDCILVKPATLVQYFFLITQLGFDNLWLFDKKP